MWIRSIKAVKSQITPAISEKLRLGESETVIDIDGAGSGQSVLLHEGTSTYPGEGSLGVVCLTP